MFYKLVIMIWLSMRILGNGLNRLVISFQSDPFHIHVYMSIVYVNLWNGIWFKLMRIFLHDKFEEFKALYLVSYSVSCHNWHLLSACYTTMCNLNLLFVIVLITRKTLCWRPLTSATLSQITTVSIVWENVLFENWAPPVWIPISKSISESTKKYGWLNIHEEPDDQYFNSLASNQCINIITCLMLL